jgi:uncharacterized cupredoxin-like copper-binding protein
MERGRAAQTLNSCQELEMRLVTAWTLGGFALFAAAPALGHGEGPGGYGEPGDPNGPARTVTIVMEETDDGHMVFAPDFVEIRQGEQIRFVLENRGELDHEFVLGTEGEIDAHAALMKQFPEMEHDDPNSKRLAPGAEGEIVWRFTVAGTFDFACLIPGHIESGMIGAIAVKNSHD